MVRHALIDLCFPAHDTEPGDVVAAAKAAGLDAIVLVSDDPDDLPEHGELAALGAAGGLAVHTGCFVTGLGFRMAILVPGDPGAVNLAAIEASGDPALVQAAVRELRGCALPICPRQGGEGVVHRQVAPLPAEPPVGVVAMIAGGSHLGRDLDIEDAGAQGRRILGATGPFGQLEDIGRYVTLLPADPADINAIIRCLNEGHGVAIELGGAVPAPTQEQPPAGRRGRRGPPDAPGEPGGDEKPRRRRRRRRRGPKGEG